MDMVWYVLFGLLIATVAMTGSHARPGLFASTIAVVYLTGFVGLRHHVGMDWNNYLRMIERAALATDLRDLMDVSEPAYSLILFGAHASGYGIYAANVVTTMIFAAGLIRLCNRAREPWLALMVAAPFLIVVIAMSASRQAAAIGIICWAVADWEESGTAKRSSIIILAGLFHYSALIFLGLVGLARNLPPWLKLISISFYIIFVYVLLSQIGQIEYYSASYLDGSNELTQSSGALYHVSLNAIPGALYLLLPSRRAVLFPNQLLRQVAIIAILLAPLALVSSSAAARLSLYCYPMSILVLAATPDAFSAHMRASVRLGIVVCMMIVLVGWLALGNSAFAHFPYQNALFTDRENLEIAP